MSGIGNDLRKREEQAIEEQARKWEREREVEESEIREACNRVARKAFAYIETGYDEVGELMRRAMENLAQADMNGAEKNRAVFEFAKVFNRMMDVSGRLASIAYVKMRKGAGEDEQTGWLELVDQIKGGAKRLSGPVEIVVKAEKKASGG